MSHTCAQGQETEDVTVLDIEMPFRSGYDIARAARASADAASLALVALTGWTRPSERIKAREAGFDMFLTKPVDFVEVDALLGRLGSLLRGKPR